MPLVSLNGLDALEIRRTNEFAGWGLRNQENRVEPVASPAFEVPFLLKPGEKIFTIGSCFARNVEGELVDRGFELPMRDLFKTGEFKDLPYGIVNNFGAPSIYNELAWAFGEKEFSEEDNFQEVAEGKFVDLHIISSVRPAPLEVLRVRRNGLCKATRTIAECRVVIITLGLVELWWDNVTQCYLNTAPLPMLMRREPDRFALHVLSFEECYDFAKRALNLIIENGQPDVEIILSVSPVPLMATHRDADVMVANSYSKSVLRTVVEQVVAEHKQVTYFPSYESITLSNRQVAWSNDFVHVSPEIVAFNVERMVDEFTGKKGQSGHALSVPGSEPAESPSALLLAEKARLARGMGNAEFFEENMKVADKSPAFAFQYAQFLFEEEQYDEVLQYLPENDDKIVIMLRAQTLFKTGHYRDARTIAEALALPEVKGIRHWRLMLDAAAAERSVEEILKVEEAWKTCQPRYDSVILGFVGAAFTKIGEHQMSVDRFGQADPLADLPNFIYLECSRSLVALKMYDDAKKVLDQMTKVTDGQVRRIGVLRRQIESESKKLSEIE